MMSKMIKLLKKAGLLCLCAILLAVQIILPQTVTAASTDDEEFQLFLAQYLDNNYMTDNMDQLMIHQYLYSYMEQ